jgi:hypothetical protein
MGFSCFRLERRAVSPFRPAPEKVDYEGNAIPYGSALVYDPYQRMDDAEPNLKVTDRRHFTAEGELKPQAEAVSAAESAADQPIASEAEGSPEPSDVPGDGSSPVSFSSFIVSIAAQAADFMGGESRNLGAARQMIGALEMLKDKSEGRRTEEETRIIEAILFDLRMAFVGAAKGTKS